jgi:hypothetical protein
MLVQVEEAASLTRCGARGRHRLEGHAVVLHSSGGGRKVRLRRAIAKMGRGGGWAAAVEVSVCEGAICVMQTGGQGPRRVCIGTAVSLVISRRQRGSAGGVTGLGHQRNGMACHSYCAPANPDSGERDVAVDVLKMTEAADSLCDWGSAGGASDWL